MLEVIQGALGHLSKSERRVAEVVLSDPEQALQQSIQAMAKLAKVSEPTVLRFCRGLGAEGYQDFKLRLAKGLASGGSFFYRDVDASDSASELVEKIVDSTMSSLMQIKQQLDFDALESAMTLFAKCERVEFYGSGGSGVVAEDAQLKFFRLGKPAIAYSDSHIQHAAASLLDSGCLVIAISASGRNRDLIHTLNIARENGASIIAITAANSAIARLSDLTLSVDLVEDSDIFSPVKSRLAQMLLLDILAVGVGVREGRPLLERLEKARRAIDFKFVRSD